MIRCKKHISGLVHFRTSVTLRRVRARVRVGLELRLRLVRIRVRVGLGFELG